MGRQSPEAEEEIKNGLHNVDNVSEVMIMDERIVRCSTSEQKRLEISYRYVISSRAPAGMDLLER